MGADYDVMGSSGSNEEQQTGEEEQQQPLLKKGRDTTDDILIEVPPSSFGFNYGSRPYRDKGFAIAFLIFVALSLSFGIFAAFNGNSDIYGVDSASYNRAQGCVASDGLNGAYSNPATSSVANMGTLLSFDASSGSMDPSVKALLYVLLVTLVLSAPLAFFLLWLLRTYAKEFVYATMPLIVILPLVFNITWFVLCNKSEECKDSLSSNFRYSAFIFVFILNLLFVWVIFSNRERIELTIRILRTASEALYQNLSLLFVLPGLNLVYCIYLVPAATFLYFAYTNGNIVVNPELVQDPELVCGPGTDMQCCVWQVDSWVPAYITLAIFVILWGGMILAQIHYFTISGTISQWYFATTESSSVGTTKRSIRHAFGPSFGTLCFSGLIVAFIRMIRSAIESTKGNRGGIGVLACLIHACLECLLSAVEFLTKFTVSFAAITGESLCNSALMTFNLLKRNFLSTLVVEAVTGRLLAQAVIVCSAVYGLLVWAALWLFVNDGKNMWFIALVAFFVLLLLLVYCSQVLQDVIDTVYICYAMDKDYNKVSKPDVHEVYVLLPASKDDTATLAVRRDARG